jgi:hypothetical protein
MSSRIDVDILKAQNPPESVMARLGLSPKRVGKRLVCPCPGCGKDLIVLSVMWRAGM